MSFNNTNATVAAEVDIDFIYIDRIILFTISNSVNIPAIIANGIVIYLTKKYYQFNNSAMYVRAAYAFMDIFLGISLIIHSCLKLFTDAERLDCWVANIGGAVFLSTIQMTAIIAVERYFYFCEPMKYPRIFTLKTITGLTIGVLAISEGYMISTEIFIGRKSPSFLSSCQLEGQSYQKLLQLLVFFIPAMASTCFSIFKITKLIYTTQRTMAPGDDTAALRTAVGRKTLRYLCFF